MFENIGTAREDFTNAVNRLHEQIDITSFPTTEQRLADASDLIESYISATGERPPNKPLKRLADYLLIDYLTDKRKQTRENPFHSDGQSRRRTNTELANSYDPRLA